MKKKDIKYFRELLTERLEELLEHANDTVSGMIAPKDNMPDPTDRASLEADRNFMLPSVPMKVRHRPLEKLV
jgi:DnaK suppressor protein